MKKTETARQLLLQSLGPDAVVWDRIGRMLYEYDGGVDRALPDLVAFPSSEAHVQRIVAIAEECELPIIPRGAGTGLSGGAIAREGGIVVAFNRMRKIQRLDFDQGRAVVEPGVVNLELSQAAAPAGYIFAPDPSSQQACTIGGNVAENSGGPHTLAYGVTVNHITGLRGVLSDGRAFSTGGFALDPPGYDLTGTLVGSEGTLALITAIAAKLTRLPEDVRTLLAVYARIEDAAATVSAVTAVGITPAAMEMLDGFTLRAVEEYIHAGYPLDSAAVLLIELEGLREETAEQSERVQRVCRECGATEVRVARDAEDRARLWKGRKHAFGAVGRISPNFYVMDGVIPRTRIAAVLRDGEKIGRHYGLRIGNIFHAGDGNLHPLVFYNGRDADEFRRALTASREIIRLCVEAGGSISGEHGVGMEKDDLMPWMFSEEDLDFMRRLRQIWNPEGRLNPGKLLPAYRACRETRLADAIGGPLENEWEPTGMAGAAPASAASGTSRPA